MAATDQIRQMVNFILQEAHEKANEIRVKVRAMLRQRRTLCSPVDGSIGEGKAFKLNKKMFLAMQ